MGILARRRKEPKSPSVCDMLTVQQTCQETVSLRQERDSSAAEIIRRTEPTGVEFIAEQRSAALSLAASQTVDSSPGSTGELLSQEGDSHAHPSSPLCRHRHRQGFPANPD